MGAKNHKDTKLSPQREKFIYEYLNGKSLTDAFIEAYPKRCANIKRESISIYASSAFAEPKTQAYYEKLLEEFREREKTKIGWTREQAIETLRFVIDTNKKDLERIEDACEAELKYLKEQIDSTSNPEAVSALIEMMINKRKLTRANRVNNDGIISSVAELNKMQGFNEQTINMNGSVVFEGEEELSE